MVRTRAWRNGDAAERDFPVDRVSDLVADADTFVWVDYTDPVHDDLVQVEQELGIHALAVEDAVEQGQRPKLDRYRDSLFLVVYDVGGLGEDGELVTHEVKAFVTEHALVTIHGADVDTAAMEHRLDANADVAEHGVPWLVWALLDAVVDHATETVEDIERRIDDLEDDLFERGNAREQQIQRRSFRLRKALGVLRRLVVPTRDSVASLLHGDAETISDGIRPYFRDVEDHLVSISDSVEQLRDAVSSVLDTNLNLASNRQNTVMKKVTSWAAIIAIPTAITGFFGQNVTFPGEGAWSGLYVSLALIVASSLVLYRVFKARDWL
ncbi:MULTISPECIES: magnesium transporter CorA family protein [unclassified Curtobacterium]|uniref:magnesium transporter CorA family protein n=1 Tax=Bacteria TaxID=2 RepID=UPI000F484F1A|nr:MULTISPECIES: magnesium transporter CorA family protein [unclassified Curtobacterium]MBF4586766.1 magnesium transporter CorA family protein [Curtobacterium sp. VKM Ac-2887]ROS47733.1 magnesium transporter [Curtobacterium sp. PhB78]RPE80711.1 magnesium transporter [Curtobacterium sp. PhB137]TCL74426.1 magnesium transporter [Curtobacterium sp. PhB128]TCL86693.1 magnesium transporter [Curtobacterium sp. PhB142]